MKFDVLPSTVYQDAIDVVIYDNTAQATSRWPKTFLHKKLCGEALVRGFDSWGEALVWLNGVSRTRMIRSLQIWGKGGFGSVYIGERCLNIRALSSESHMHDALATLKTRLTPDAVVWFRSSHTFCTDIGQRFAEAFANFMGCTVIGHTFGLNIFQSGLRTVEPGAKADWPEGEGLAEAADGTMQRAGSAPWRPSTVLFCRTTIPRRW